MTRLLRFVIGGLATVVIALGAAWFSANPSVRVLPADSALVKMSFAHGGQRNCRALTAGELSKLPPNMRRTEICDRERQPIYVELEIDGRIVFARALPPSGVAGDGASRVYQRFVLPAGRHDFSVRLREKPGSGAFDYTAERTITLAPAQSFAIDFRADAGGFVFN